MSQPYGLDDPSVITNEHQIPPPQPPPLFNTVDLLHQENKQDEMFHNTEEQQHFRMSEVQDLTIFEITVSNPEKKGDGMTAYTCYSVNTKLETLPSKYRQVSVPRRYRDFVWLRKKLVSRGDGWLVPPLPAKAIIGRFSPVFVDSRRRGLELFLNRLSKHIALSQAPEFKLFLYGSADELMMARTGKPQGSPDAEGDHENEESVAVGAAAAPPPVAAASSNTPTSARSFMSYLSEFSQSTMSGAAALAQSVSNSWVAANNKDREKTKDDITCDSIHSYSEALDKTVGAVHKNVAHLTSTTKDISNAWFEFGFTCNLLGQFETEQDEKQLGVAFAKLGSCADKLSVLFNQQVDSQLIYFQEPFDDFLRSIECVKEMLKARQNSLTSYYIALSNLESKQATLAKYQSKPGKEHKAQAAEQEVMEAQRKVDETLYNLQHITERVFTEMGRFRQEKRVNFKNIMQDYIRMQIEHSRKMQEIWESMLPEVQNFPSQQ